MIKYHKIKQLKLFTISFTSLKYSFWYLFFILQGRSIELAITKNKILTQLIYSLMGFVILKILVMLCDIMQKFVNDIYTNDELKWQWENYFPSKIYRDNEDNYNYINLLFFEYLPKLLKINVSITYNYTTLFFVFTLSISAFLFAHFYMGILALITIFALNCLSKNIFVKKINRNHQSVNGNKKKIYNWIVQYHRAYREISKNWSEFPNPKWHSEIYKDYFLIEKNQTILYLFRNLISQAFVEFPFLINSILVILGVYYGYLSLTKMFVWIGLSQFAINASNAFLENQINKKHRFILIQQCEEILSLFKPFTGDDELVNPIQENIISKVVMRDGVKNILSTIPGIYPIKGENGSGKSTLLNVILGHERKYKILGDTHFKLLVKSLQPNNIRLIERTPIIFECFSDFNSQILGKNDYAWREKIQHSLKNLVVENLSEQWMNIFLALEEKYISRKDKDFSSGERIILSCMRFFASWNNGVKLLIIDECDSFLDEEKRDLFFKTINLISSRMAIFISTHWNEFDKWFYPRLKIPHVSITAVESGDTTSLHCF